MMNNITAHIIVKNEEVWIWYALLSVVKYIDSFIIYDTGSTDRTNCIISHFIDIYGGSKKIKYEKKGVISKEKFYCLRQEQIDLTESEWFLVLDGDEIWYEDGLRELVQKIKNPNLSLIACKFHNAVSDIYHYKDFQSESYTIKGITGAITIRAYRKNFKGIHCKGDYGVEGYFDCNGEPIQKHDNYIEVLDKHYFHASYLQRSSSLKKDWEIPYRRNKVFARAQKKVSANFEFPEVFYDKKPSFIMSPWRKRGWKYIFFRTLHLILQSMRYVRKKLSHISFR